MTDETKHERKTLWESVLLPRLDEIGELYGKGMTRAQICATLGVAENTLRAHEVKHKELADVLTRARAKVAGDLCGALYRLALGAERRTITKKGGEEIETVETLPPNLAALSKLLEVVAPEIESAQQNEQALTDDEKRERACRILGIPNTGPRSTSADDFENWKRRNELNASCGEI